MASLRVPFSLGLDGLTANYAFSCLGFDGYTWRAVVWTVTPLYMTFLMIVAAVVRALVAREKISAWTIVERTAGRILRMLFLLQPCPLQTDTDRDNF